MLHYRDGAVRTLGQVRLHVAASETIVNPTHICIFYESGKQYSRFISDLEHICDTRRANGTCWALSNCAPLQWWFNERNSLVGFLKDLKNG